MSGQLKPYQGHRYAGVHKSLNIEPGDLLCRVWNSAAGETEGFDATTWNPQRKTLEDQSAGRFDLLPSSDAGGGILYGSQAAQGYEVAILETFRSLMARSENGGRNVIARSERDRRSLRTFEVIEPTELVNINTQAGRECFRMDEEVLYVHNRPITREWSEAVMTCADDAAGIAYNSTRESLQSGMHSFILWETRSPNPQFRTIENIPLRSAEGRQLVDDALDDFGVQWA